MSLLPHRATLMTISTNMANRIPAACLSIRLSLQTKQERNKLGTLALKRSVAKQPTANTRFNVRDSYVGDYL
jgi:hypothetical protein